MRPRIIVHNSVSLDGSLTNFEPHMQLHYQIAGGYKPDAHLIGSHTISEGIKLYADGVSLEVETDFIKPTRDEQLPLWFIIDTKAQCSGLLHMCRRFEYTKDVIVFVSDSTPASYLEYLGERQYPYHSVGSDHVDLQQVLRCIYSQYQVKTLLTDAGRILTNLLLNQGCVDEISVLVHPVIVGTKGYTLFSDSEQLQTLQLHSCKVLQDNLVWLVYTRPPV